MNNKIIMIKDFVLSYFSANHKYDYWHCPHLCSQYIKQWDYFINFIPKTKYPGPFDEQKIPMLDMSTQHWSKSKRTIYSPIVICQYGLGHYSKYIRNKQQSDLSTFLQISNWVQTNLNTMKIQNQKVAVFYMDYGKPNILSGMAQGLAISVLTRAYKITKQNNYLQKAIEVFNIFKIDIKDGGVIDHSLGFPIIEEWTDEKNHIFNGHIFGFVGIIDLRRTKNLPKEKQEEITNYYHLYLKSTIKLAQKIDMLFWTKYSVRSTLLPNIASYFYHKLHIEIMKGLYILTSANEFRIYSLRWHKQSQNIVYKTLALILKLIDRIYYEFKRKN